MDRRELVDAKFAVKVVEDHFALFGKPPRAYAYDRAGHSEKNVKRLKELGVKEEELVKERALLEAGSIGRELGRCE